MNIKEWLGEDNVIGVDIWEKKYRRNDESFDEWLDRVSGRDDTIRNLILQKKFLFGGRILSNRGVPDEDEHTTYSNCYVISPPEDSIESIYDTCKKLARTYSYGGGCGIDISKLAPSGAKVHNQAKTTSGAVSFMDTFSQVTEQIGQNGRRGALMICMKDTHPDIEKFIHVKNNTDKVTAANISVMVSDAFMKAVQRQEDWELKFTRKETKEVITKTVKATDLFEQLCESNWNYAEPGILFWDRICGYSLLGNNPDFEYAGTNPCGELPLPAGGACLLGALNLSAFVDEEGRFNDREFACAVQDAVKALNEVLDEGLSKHPLEEQRNSVRDWRQIGLGIMGLADMLIKMGVAYGSKPSIDICNRIGHLMISNAILQSSHLAKQFGSYPNYNDLVLQTDFFQNHSYDKLTAMVECYGLRNSQLLTIAPTGTISTMLGVSGGIEPIFANSYERVTKSLHGKDVKYKIYTPIVKRFMEDNGIDDEEQLPKWFVTASTLTIQERIEMQATWQFYIDNSISSTVNLPNSATVDDVREVYQLAWRMGLKGVTVYRDGCERAGILVNNDSKKEDKSNPKVRGDKNIGYEKHLITGCGSLHVCAYFDEYGNLNNTYLSKGSSGGCNCFMIGLSRLISLSARNGVGIETIIDQLNSCGTCPSYAIRRATKGDVSPGSCCPVAVGNALREMWREAIGDKNVVEEKMDSNSDSKCPECGASLIFEGGCNTCKICGWSRCS